MYRTCLEDQNDDNGERGNIALSHHDLNVSSQEISSERFDTNAVGNTERRFHWRILSGRGDGRKQQ